MSYALALPKRAARLAVALASRTVFFVGGAPIRATPADLALAWKGCSVVVPTRYAFGTAQHEADFATNEVDTESSGYVSKGIFQLSTEEAASVGFGSANLLMLQDAVKVMASLSDARTLAILRATGWACTSADKVPSDVWAYLTVAHNQGLEACLVTIEKHGLDWAAYCKRNLEASVGTDKEEFWKKVVAYGNDAISGGSLWTPAYA